MIYDTWQTLLEWAGALCAETRETESFTQKWCTANDMTKIVFGLKSFREMARVQADDETAIVQQLAVDYSNDRSQLKSSDRFQRINLTEEEVGLRYGSIKTYKDCETFRYSTNGVSKQVNCTAVACGQVMYIEMSHLDNVLGTALQRCAYRQCHPLADRETILSNNNCVWKDEHQECEETGAHKTIGGFGWDCDSYNFYYNEYFSGVSAEIKRLQKMATVVRDLEISIGGAHWAVSASFARSGDGCKSENPEHWCYVREWVCMKDELSRDPYKNHTVATMCCSEESPLVASEWSTTDSWRAALDRCEGNGMRLCSAKELATGPTQSLISQSLVWSADVCVPEKVQDGDMRTSSGADPEEDVPFKPEVFYSGTFYSICRQNFDTNMAQKVCEYFGFRQGRVAESGYPKETEWTHSMWAPSFGKGGLGVPGCHKSDLNAVGLTCTGDKNPWTYYAAGCGQPPYLMQMTGDIKACILECNNLMDCKGVQRSNVQNSCYILKWGVSSRVADKTPTTTAQAAEADWMCAVKPETAAVAVASPFTTTTTTTTTALAATAPAVGPWR
jgi:hypothetical protein